MKPSNHDIDTLQVSSGGVQGLTIAQRIGNKAGADQTVIERAIEIL